MFEVIEKEEVGLTVIHFTFKDMEVAFVNLGATLLSVELDGKNMLLTPKNIHDLKNENCYYGKTIGRVANRIKGNEVKINDRVYKLEDNENGNVLHGGKNGLSTKVFDYQVEDDGVTFSYISKEGESGFPGNLFVRVKYIIDPEEKTIEVRYSATSDKTTLCSLTTHPFFMLGEDNCLNLQLYLDGEQYLYPNPTDLIAMRKDKISKALDFNAPKKIGEDIDDDSLQYSKARGYDHYYFFKDIDPEMNKIILSGKDYQLCIKTDFEGAQIYSDNVQDDIECYGTNKKVNRALAIEPADNHLVPHLIEPSMAYQHFIKYKFFKK